MNNGGEDHSGTPVAVAVSSLMPSGFASVASSWRAWVDYLLTPVDGASLAVFRMAFGMLMIWDVWNYWANGWILSDYIEPTYHFTYPFFHFIRPWPGHGMYWQFAVLAVLAALMAVGFYYRLAACGFFLAFTDLFLLDETCYLNHNYLICLLSLLLAIVPAQSAWSLDAWRDRKTMAKPPARFRCDGTVPRWSLLLLRIQVSLVYFFAGLAKLNDDWLGRYEPLDSWLKSRAHWPVIPHLLATPGAIPLMIYGSTLFDLTAGFLLWGRRTFWPTAVVALIFHLLNSYLFQIGVFPWLSLAALTLYRSPGWPRQWIGSRGARTGELKRNASEPQGQASDGVSLRQSACLAFFHLYLAVQLAVPLRQWLYPGDVSWTEEGHRFSWHMKLRHKNIKSFAMFATDPWSGLRREIDPLQYLSRHQLREMSRRPDMILQFAHHIADLEQARTGVRPVVNARVVASLNARPYQDLIDPAVDLAATPESLGHAKFIVPIQPY